MAELEPVKQLKVAIIYSYGANEEEIDGIIDEENPESTWSRKLIIHIKYSGG